MFSDPSLNLLFAQAFFDQQEGWAVYPPISGNKMKPGACGYFDDNGNWHKIVQLTDADEVEGKLGKEVKLLDPSVQPEVEEGITTTWSAKVSTNVHGSKVNLNSIIVPPGSPASANVGWEYTCDSSAGAVILAPDKIITSGLNGVDKARIWMDDHVEDIANAADDPKSASKKGLFLITTTYATPRRAIAVMQKKKGTASFHVGAEISPGGKIEASSAFWDSDQSGSGWEISKEEKEGSGIILFVQGIWWHKHIFLEDWEAEEEKKHQLVLEHYTCPLVDRVEHTLLQWKPVRVGPGGNQHGSNQSNMSIARGLLGAHTPWMRART